VDLVTAAPEDVMKLETSQDLLNRIRARHEASWYGLAELLGTHKNTVYNWKGGHTVVDRKFAPRIAELLDESAEYVLACLEADREQDPEVLKVWRRIAERFRSTATILLMALGLMTAHGRAGAPELDVVLAQELSNQQLIHYAQFAAWARRRLSKLCRCLGLKSRSPGPLPPLWARIRSMGLPLSRSPA